jgi:hypothetical protein
MRRLTALIISSIAVTACAADASREAERVEAMFDTVGPAVHVRIRGMPPSLTVTPIVRIGSAEGDAASNDEMQLTRSHD